MLVAIPIGVYSAMRPGSFVDRFAMIADPDRRRRAPALARLHALVRLRLPARRTSARRVLRVHARRYRLQRPRARGPTTCFLPWLTLGLGVAALYARMIRACDAWRRCTRTSSAPAARKGSASGTVVRRHVVPNALLPIVTMVAMDAALLFGSAVFVERVFNLPGLGTLLTIVAARPRSPRDPRRDARHLARDPRC